MNKNIDGESNEFPRMLHNLIFIEKNLAEKCPAEEYPAEKCQKHTEGASNLTSPISSTSSTSLTSSINKRRGE